MKPRRWYSSPELKPHPSPSATCPFPSAVYWAFTAKARREQGPIIKTAPAATPKRPAARAAPARPPLRIEAA